MTQKESSHFYLQGFSFNLRNTLQNTAIQLPVAIASASGIEEELALVGLVIVEVGLLGLVACPRFPICKAIDLGFFNRVSDFDDNDVIHRFRSLQ
jgi:hypothetical protein